MPRRTSHEIDDLAAAWAARVDAGSLEPDDSARLDAWLAEDVRNFGAYAKARAVLSRVERARVLTLDPDGTQFSDLGLNEAPVESAWPSRRLIVGAGWLSASAAAAAIVLPKFGRWWNSRLYTTSIGETQVVPLEDGSVVTLNTDSQIAAAYSATQRSIKLLRGEALFDVAKDKKRPFVVEAEGTTVRAVGTSFSVSLAPDSGVRVLVREGVVELRRPEVPVAPAVQLYANHLAVAPVDAPIAMATVEPTEVRRALSWRVGRLAFEGETLASAAQAFARYSKIQIQIDDPEVANRTVTGLFVSNDPVGFSNAVAASLGLHVEVGGNVVKLSQ